MGLRGIFLTNLFKNETFLLFSHSVLRNQTCEPASLMMSAFIFRLSSIHRRPGWVIFIHILRFSSRRRDEPRRSGTKCHTARRPRAAVSVSSSLARASLSDIRSPASRSSSPPLLFSSARSSCTNPRKAADSQQKKHTLSLHTHTHQSCCSPPSPSIHSLPSFGCSQKCFL